MKYALTLISALAFAAGVPVFLKAKSDAPKSAAAVVSNDEPQFMRDLGREEQKVQNSYFSFFVRSVLTVGLFIGALYVIYRYLKKRSAQSGLSSNLIKLLGVTALAQNRFVCLIEIAERIFLVGVSESSVTLLSEIEDKDTKDFIRVQGALSPTNQRPGIFADMLADVQRAFSGKRDEKKPLEFTKEIKERLRNLGK
jgi:flagellar biosynthetic protein FliO